MSFGISIMVNDDGSIEVSQDNAIKFSREKGQSLIATPSDYTVIDIETTGLDPRYDEIIEIGAIRIEGGKVTDTFESLIKPNGYYFDEDGKEYFNYVDEFITELTGINNEMLHNAPSINQVLPKFVDFIKDDILLGHNVNFDINFLYDSLMTELDHKLHNNYVDLMRLSRKVFPEFENHKLATVANNLDVNSLNSHRALADCMVTNECYQKLSSHLTANNIELESLWKNNKYINLKSIESNNTEFNEEHPLYNKFCTFTGKLEKMERKAAAQLVIDLGGKCLNSVTKQTNFLILGNFDYSSNIKDGKSSKMKKAEQLILKGQDLQVLSENVFYDLVLNK